MTAVFTPQPPPLNPRPDAKDRSDALCFAIEVRDQDGHVLPVSRIPIVLNPLPPYLHSITARIETSDGTYEGTWDFRLGRTFPFDATT